MTIIYFWREELISDKDYDGGDFSYCVIMIIVTSMTMVIVVIIIINRHLLPCATECGPVAIENNRFKAR